MIDSIPEQKSAADRIHRKINADPFLLQEKGQRLCSVSVKQNQQPRFYGYFERYLLTCVPLFSLAIFKNFEGDIPVMRLNVTVKLLRELKPRLAAMASMVR